MTMPDPAPPFEKLTEYQKSVICNGCGGKGGTVPVPQFMFSADCNEHDYHYWIGGTDEDRKAADDEFYSDLVFDADRAADRTFWLWRWPYRAWFRHVAMAYYLAVRSCGAKYFSFGPKKTTADLPTPAIPS